VTDSNDLLTFDSGSPGTVTTTAITGLPAGFSILGFAQRTTTQPSPANPGVGSLWAVASNGGSTDFRLLVISTSGAASQISPLGNLGSGPGMTGWSLAFDPATDRFQFSGVQLNYQINPNTGTAVAQGNLFANNAYSGSAFAFVPFGGSSRFYDIDCGGTPDVLQTSTNIAAGGTPTTVGPLGMDFSRPIGLAIISSGAFAAASGSLYTVNLSTGAFTNPVAIMGSPTVVGLVIVPPSFPVATVTVQIKGKKKVTTSKTSLVIKGTATSGAGITQVQYKIGSGKFKKAKGTTNWKFTAKLKPGTNTISVKAIGGNGVVSSIAKVKVKVSAPL
jgi:hypothetical protein